MYQVISNFNGGLDARKYFLSLPPGTLTTLVNGHITQGGEIEKRKAFVPSQLPAGTFGAQETLDGIVVFGSRTLPTGNYQTISRLIELNTIAIVGLNTSYGSVDFLSGDTVQVSGMGDPRYNTGGTILVGDRAYPALVIYTVPSTTDESVITDTGGTVSLVIPPGIIYQQLTHPLAGVSMTGVLSSTYFNGKVAVVTTWSNGDTLVFYDGAVVQDFYVGAYGSIEPSSYAMAQDLAAALTASGLYQTSVEPLNYLTVEITGGSSGTGNQITALTYDFQRSVTLPNASTSNPQTLESFPLLNAALTWTGSSTTDMANALAAAIAGNYYGFTATATGNVVTVKPPATDAGGIALGLNALDMIAATVGGNVTVYTPPNDGVFEVYSIPTQSSATPYSVAVTTENATLDYKLVSNGVAATAPANAAGQFSITAGGSNPTASGVLTVSGTGPQKNDTVTIGSTVYTFVVSPAVAAYQVSIGGSATATLTNLVAAINGTAGAGSAYGSGTLTNTQVSASAVVGSATTITAIIGGSGGSNATRGNNLAASTTSANLSWDSATNVNHKLTGGGAAAANTVKYSSTTAIADGNTVVVNGKTYTFKTALTSTDGYVQIVTSAGSIPADNDATMFNLLCAINLTGTPGTQYASNTTKHPTVTAINQDTTNHALTLSAIATGAVGNALTLTATATIFTTGGTTFSGGGTDPNQITNIFVGTQPLLGSYVAFNNNPNQTAADVVTAINNNSGTSGYTATAQNNVITVTAAAAGASANEAVIAVQCGGNVCIAACSITVTAATGGGISGISAADGNGSHALLTNSGLVFQQTGYGTETLQQYLTRVVTNINANTGASGYLAYSSGAQVWLSKATVTSADVGPDPKDGITVTSSLVITSAATTALTVTNNTQSISFSTNQPGALGRTAYYSNNQPASAVVTVSGGVAPYTYQWSSTVASPDAIPQLSNTPNQWWTLVTVKSSGLKPPATTIVSQHNEAWVCTVTDSTGVNPVVSAPFYLVIPTIAVNA
jgi:hypothetical protein